MACANMAAANGRISQGNSSPPGRRCRSPAMRRSTSVGITPPRSNATVLMMLASMILNLGRRMMLASMILNLGRRITLPARRHPPLLLVHIIQTTMGLVARLPPLTTLHRFGHPSCTVLIRTAVVARQLHGLASK